MELLEKNIWRTGTGLFVFSDPGGAKGILALVSLLKKYSGFNYILASDRDYSFTKNFDVDIKLIQSANWVKINIEQFDYVVTGTSYTSDIENQTIKYSKNINITCFSFVDHWVNIKKRFLLNNKLVFPSKVWVIDEEAKKIGIKEGVTASILEVTGNPYHYFLSLWRPKKNKVDFCLSNNISPTKQIILFAPDSVSNLNWKDVYGFDEGTITKWVIESIFENSLFDDFQLIIKLHPNQNQEVIKNQIDLFDQLKVKYSIKLFREIELNTALFYSEIIIGQFSNILLEANVLGKKNVLRVIPNGSEDYLKNKIGVVCKNKFSLSAQLKNLANEIKQGNLS